MLSRLRHFFDVRPGEGLRVLLSFLYVAVVVAAFLLAKPIRNSLFLQQYGPYALVYVYAAVPLALSLFVPVYSRVAARIGLRAVTVATLIFFSINVLLFWYAFRAHPAAGLKPGALAWLLPAMFYVWVNCFGAIAPVQAWSFASTLFDTRQAKRLFGLIGAGASLGAITGGLLARFLVVRVGGTVNMMLVLAALILFAAGIVVFANIRLRRPDPPRGRPVRHPFVDSMRQIAASPYLRLMAALVFLVAISTQWTAFQLSLVAAARFGGDADDLTRFFGTFNFCMGAVTFVLQLLLAGPALRRFGVGITILLLPLSLGLGSTLILLMPAFWPVLLTNASDQGFRFSIDKATYELLYLPFAPARRAPIKNAIDIVVSRFGDAVGAVLLGTATQGFFMLRGMGLGLRGTAAINLAMIGAWLAVAWRLRVEYVRTIQEGLHQHRIDSERPSAGVLDRSTVVAIGANLDSDVTAEVLYALGVVGTQPLGRLRPAVRRLLEHEDAEVRQGALAILSAAHDRTIGARAAELLRDPNLGVRTEALLYVTREMGVDPLRQLEQLGDVEDFSIRAGMAAFLISPGPSQNLDAARLMLEAMVRAEGPAGIRDRMQAARVLGLAPDSLLDLLTDLLRDEDEGVALQGVLATRASTAEALVAPLVALLDRPAVAEAAAVALARYGDALVPEIDRLLRDAAAPLAIKRELPAVLVRIGTPMAQGVLIEGLLQPDVTLRHRIVTSLNKLHDAHPEVQIDQRVIELLLAAEIAGHYRSYQVMGPLRAGLKDNDAILQALHDAMELELERIFRLMALLFEGPGLHDAYVGLRSRNTIVRANSLEFLDNVLKPELRRVLVPLLDSQVSIGERIALADRFVGAPLETAEQAVGTLLASEEPWLRSCAIYAVGALRLHGLEGELRKLEEGADPVVREGAYAARQRLTSEAETTQHPPVPAEVDMGVG